MESQKKQRPTRLLSGLWACGTPQVGQCFVRLRVFRLAASEAFLAFFFMVWITQYAVRRQISWPGCG